MSYTKEERTAYNKAYREANREKIAASDKIYREANRDKIAARKKISDKAYYDANSGREKARSIAWYKANLDKAKASNKAWKAANLTYNKLYSKAWYDANSDKAKADAKLYREANPGKILAHNAKRRSAKLQRTPIWTDLEAIKQVYIDCIEINMAAKLAGCVETFVVDHIVPLQGVNVSGLHIVNNLQIITAKENSEKSNKFIS